MFKALITAIALQMTQATAVAQDRTFGAYDCTDDCSGHAAGYGWAEANGITDPNECPMGNSQSFYEGCLVYTEDPGRGSEEADDGDPID